MNKDKCIDPLTKEEFIPKKISQRFASPANRIKYNNQLAKKDRLERAKIDKPMQKNYKILKELVKEQKNISVHEEYLNGKGFDFTLFNHYKIYKGIKYPTIYEFILIMAEGNPYIKIVKDESRY